MVFRERGKQLRLLVRAVWGHIKIAVDRIASLARHDHADGAVGYCAGAYTVAKVRLAAVDVLAVPELLNGDTAVLNGRGRLRMVGKPTRYCRGHLCIRRAGERFANLHLLSACDHICCDIFLVGFCQTICLCWNLDRFSGTAIIASRVVPHLDAQGIWVFQTRRYVTLGRNIVRFRCQGSSAINHNGEVKSIAAGRANAAKNAGQVRDQQRRKCSRKSLKIRERS